MTQGVILLSLGGPRRLEEIPTFIRRFTNRELSEVALTEIINRYRSIGGGSPLVDITEKQAKQLGKILGDNCLCLAAFGYVSPFLEEVLDRVVSIGLETVLIVFMSPFYAYIPCDDYLRRINDYQKNFRPPIIIRLLHSWYREDVFVRLWVHKLKSEIEDDPYFLFSAHSLPKTSGGKAELYEGQVKELVEILANRTGIQNYSLGWQSIPPRVKKEDWLGPTIEELIIEVAERGYRKVVLVPVGFTADHVETLYDIDIMCRSLALERGIDFQRISSLNDDEEFIRVLREITLRFEGGYGA